MTNGRTRLALLAGALGVAAWAVSTPAAPDVERTMPRAALVRQADGTWTTRSGVAVDVVRVDGDTVVFRDHAVALRAEAVVREELRPALPPVPPVRVAGTAFREIGDGLPRAGQWRSAVAIADVTGDGRRDVVLGAPRPTRRPPAIFARRAAGWAAVETEWPAAPYAYGGLAIGDVDRDGHADIGVAPHLGRPFVLLRRGAGFVLDVPPLPATVSSQAISFADLDADGSLDVVGVTEGGAPPSAQTAPFGGVWVTRRSSDATWHPEVTASAGPSGAAIAVADFDGDGRLDVATGSSVVGRRDVVHFGAAQGGFERRTVDGVPERAAVRAVAAGDVDGDRRADLVLAYTWNEADVWRNAVGVVSWSGREASRLRSVIVGDEPVGVTELAIGNVAGDERPEIVTASASGEVRVYTMRAADFELLAAMRPPLEGRCGAAALAVGDVDGDARDEILAGFGDDHVETDGRRRCPQGGGVALWRYAG